MKIQDSNAVFHIFKLLMKFVTISGFEVTYPTGDDDNEISIELHIWAKKDTICSITRAITYNDQPSSQIQ